MANGAFSPMSCLDRVNLERNFYGVAWFASVFENASTSINIPELE